MNHFQRLVGRKLYRVDGHCFEMDKPYIVVGASDAGILVSESGNLTAIIRDGGEMRNGTLLKFLTPEQLDGFFIPT
jgi:hypothetical protein